MVYFFIRVIVNTLAAAIVMNVVPGRRLVPFAYFGEPFAEVFSYIVIGLIFFANSLHRATCSIAPPNRWPAG